MDYFTFFNDTGKEVQIHPGTEVHGVVCDMSPIKHLEERVFELPEGTYPWVKVWDHTKHGMGLQLLVSPQVMKKV